MADTKVYLSGGRIQGRSDDSTSANATLTYTGDMSSGWTETSSGSDFTIDTTNEEVDLLNNYTADNVRWDSSTVATLSTTAWVVRFAYQNTGTASGDNPVWWVGFSTDSTVASNSTAQDFVGFGTQVGNGSTQLRPYLYATDNSRLDQADAAQRLQLNSSNVNLVSDNTKYYIEIKRDGNDFTVSAYSDSAFSTLLCSSTYTYSAVGTLRYFIIANYIQGSNVTGTFSEFNWWNGATAPVTVTAKDKSTITNVPDGTRYEETDTRTIYTKRTQTGSGGGDIWVEKGETFSASALRGFFSGGAASGARNEIEYITIQTTANANEFGDLIDSREGSGACADATRCLDGHGNSIEYWTAATLGNATDFGDLSASRSPQGGGLADTTRGVFAGGGNTIDYVTIQTLGNAADFGDLQGGYGQTSACADATRGIIGGGWTGAYVDSIDYITIQSAGNAQDFGNLSAGKYALSACSDATRGVFTGGHTGSGINVIEYITIQTLGNTTDFGDLIATVNKHANCADSTRGVSAGGGGAENRIEYFTIQTTGNSTDFGDLVVGREVTGGCAA